MKVTLRKSPAFGKFGPTYSLQRENGFFEGTGFSSPTKAREFAEKYGLEIQEGK